METEPFGLIMSSVPYNREHWRMLTPENIALRKAWGWGYSIQRQLAEEEQQLTGSRRLLVSSDFSGEHQSSGFVVYSYLVAKAGIHEYLVRVARARNEFLPDNRSMSYKRLNDVFRQRVLVSYLEAAADVDGHLVSIAVDKRIRWLSTAKGGHKKIEKCLGLKGKWGSKSLESMMRKVHFLGIISSLWCAPFGDIFWITDADEFVANERRHNDALLCAGYISSMYLPFPMRELRLNKTDQVCEKDEFEHLCAIPDLAAGMLSDVVTKLNRCGKRDRAQTRRTLDQEFSIKADILSDWYWDDTMRLRKTLLTMEMQGSQYAVRKVYMQ